MQRLAGRVAIVTGASRGIGAHIATAFGAEGAAVALVARTRSASAGSEPGTLEETAAAIEARGGRAHLIVADVLDPTSPARVVAETEAALGPCDILVNNALVSTMAPLETIDVQAVRDMLEGQVLTPLALAQLVLPGMRARGAGWIINLTSKGSRLPPGPPFSWGIRGGTSGYGSVKAAVERMTVGLAGEVHGSGIAVNALGPSRIVRTPGVMKGDWGNVGAENYEDPATIAEAAVLLASCDPETFTGKIVWSEELPTELTG
ncbi:MAG: short-chain dehydrogenase/reductase [Actinomycetia bacterium]|nr:short-chain dehydrogenase/reductase [Actinomycetes bacterium]